MEIESGEIYTYPTSSQFYRRDGTVVGTGFAYLFYRYHHAYEDTQHRTVLVWRLKPEMLEELEHAGRRVAEGKPATGLLDLWNEGQGKHDEH